MSPKVPVGGMSPKVPVGDLKANQARARIRLPLTNHLTNLPLIQEPHHDCSHAQILYFRITCLVTHHHHRICNQVFGGFAQQIPVAVTARLAARSPAGFSCTRDWSHPDRAGDFLYWIVCSQFYWQETGAIWRFPDDTHSPGAICLYGC